MVWPFSLVRLEIPRGLFILMFLFVVFTYFIHKSSTVNQELSGPVLGGDDLGRDILSTGAYYKLTKMECRQL